MIALNPDWSLKGPATTHTNVERPDTIDGNEPLSWFLSICINLQ